MGAGLAKPVITEPVWRAFLVLLQFHLAVDPRMLADSVVDGGSICTNPHLIWQSVYDLIKPG
jgi:hypothetical protein